MFRIEKPEAIWNGYCLVIEQREAHASYALHIQYHPVIASAMNAGRERNLLPEMVDPLLERAQERLALVLTDDLAIYSGQAPRLKARIERMVTARRRNVKVIVL